jgi:ABC-type amino acid transport substrate-binding protein
MQRILTIIALTLAVVALTFSLRPNSGGIKSTQESTYDRVMRTGTIRCGYSIWHPLMFVDLKTNEKVGIFPELIQEAAKRLGLKIEWQEELGWGTVVEAVKSGRVDAACAGYWLHPDRIKHVSASAPLFYSPLQVWVRADETRLITSPESLNTPEWTVGMIDGSSPGLIIAARFPNAKLFSLTQNSSNAEIIESLVAKKVDFIIDDVTSFTDYITNNPSKIRPAFPDQPLATFPAVMLLPPDDTRFKEMLDGTLALLEYDGTLDKILAKYHVEKMFIRNPALAHR